MSRSKIAYGWYGHILVPASEILTRDEMERDGLAHVNDDAFLAILEDYAKRELPGSAEAHAIGNLGFDIIMLAAGVGFSRGFTWYGTQFTQANLILDGSLESILTLRGQGQRYIDAMRERYGVELPPCRMMVGCSTDY